VDTLTVSTPAVKSSSKPDFTDGRCPVQIRRLLGLVRTAKRVFFAVRGADPHGRETIVRVSKEDAAEWLRWERSLGCQTHMAYLDDSGILIIGGKP
jgi:hypothetical protein